MKPEILDRLSDVRVLQRQSLAAVSPAGWYCLLCGDELLPHDTAVLCRDCRAQVPKDERGQFAAWEQHRLQEDAAIERQFAEMTGPRYEGNKRREPQEE